MKRRKKYDLSKEYNDVYSIDGPQEFNFILTIIKLSLLSNDFTVAEIYKTGMMVDSIIGANLIVNKHG